MTSGVYEARIAQVHEVRCSPAEYAALATGKKHVVMRPEKDGYQLHDLIVAREFDTDASELTGRHRVARITWIDRLGEGALALSVRIFREPRSRMSRACWFRVHRFCVSASCDCACHVRELEAGRERAAQRPV